MTKEQEVWREIPGYTKYYVSNTGMVMSLKMGTQKIRKLDADRDGYLRIRLSENGKTKTWFIHQLVAIAFLNHIPDRHRKVIDHIDSDKKNNNASNLRIVDTRENTSKEKRAKGQIGLWHLPNGKWRAQIRDGKIVHLGTFLTKEEAQNAYDTALLKIRHLIELC